MNTRHETDPCGTAAEERFGWPVPHVREAVTAQSSFMEQELQKSARRGHMLLVPAGQAQFRIVTDGVEKVVGPGWALLLKSGAVIDFCRGSSPDDECFVLVFDLLEPRPASDGADAVLFEKMAEPPLLVGLHRDADGFVWRDAAACLCAPLPASAGIRERMRRQSALNESVLRLCEPDRAVAATRTDSREAVGRTLSYMQQRYGEAITRTGLAEMAGLSVWHYAEVFKTLTGDSPIRHLNKLRIESARHKLLLGDSPIHTIAKESGFDDEYYFSRKFREVAGIAPSVCRSRGRQRLASVNFAYTGHLLALGAVPRAAVLDPGRDVHRRDFFDRIPVWLRRSEPMSGALVDYNLDRLRIEEPGIVLCSEWEERICRERLPARIPIAVVPWNGTDWREHLNEISSLLGLSAERKKWIGAYERQVEETGRFLRRQLGSATISLLHIRADAIEVYGARNGGTVLFDDLGLNPAYAYRDIPISRSVSYDRWTTYAGRINLVIVDPVPTAEACWLRMQSGREDDRFIRVGEMPWLDYSAHAHRQIVEETHRLLGRLF